MPSFQEIHAQDLQTIADCGLSFEPLRHTRILITGAGGLIASVLTEALLHISQLHQLELSVFALCRNREKAEKRFSAYLNNPSFHLLIQDVCEPLPKACKFDYILHAASPAHPLAYSKTPVETMQANLLGTMHLLAHAKSCDCRRFLFVSSSEVYGENRQTDQTMSEDYQGKLLSICTARACYPESKRAAEVLCAAYRQEYGLDVTVVRPGYIYGAEVSADNSRADAQFLRNAAFGQNIVMKSLGTQKRSYCYVADAVSAILYVLLKGRSGEAYNIADPNCSIQIREFAQALADAAQVEVTFALPPEEEARGYSQVANSLLCADKLLSLGWRPQYTLERGAAQAVAALQAKEQRNV